MPRFELHVPRSAGVINYGTGLIFCHCHSGWLPVLVGRSGSVRGVYCYQMSDRRLNLTKPPKSTNWRHCLSANLNVCLSNCWYPNPASSFNVWRTVQWGNHHYTPVQSAPLRLNPQALNTNCLLLLHLQNGVRS